MSCDSSSKQSPSLPVTPAAEHASTAQGYNGFSGGGEDALNGGGGELDVLPGQEAGPSEEQSLIDFDQHSICPWGPVIQQIIVPVAGTDPITVNRLSSPDPFTPTYQLPDGEIVTTNTPLPMLLAPGYTPATPPEVPWTDPVSGDSMHIYNNWILVYFKREATQAQIEQVIAQNNLQVIMSWYEPDDAAGPGNSMAWFQFEYSPQQFTNFTQAYTFFNAHPLVSLAMPDTTDDIKTCYGTPSGGTQGWPTDLAADEPWFHCDIIQAYGVSTEPLVPLGPEAGVGALFSTQVVAVVDDGVFRSHKDFRVGCYDQVNSQYSLGIKGKISWIGVDVTPREIWVGTKQNLRGEPNYISTRDNRNGPVSHGTMMAGTISAGTRNQVNRRNQESLGTGTAGLAPSALILPVRLHVTGLDAAGDDLINGDSLVKAVRAIRFNFSHEKWAEKVRVVNMSVGGSSGSWWPRADMKYNIGRDLVFNDRLYVAAAGNSGLHRLSYPAAHDNVLGVTGAMGKKESEDEYTENYSFSADPLSTYWNLSSPLVNSPYPVSGISQFADDLQGHAVYQLLPVPPGDNLEDLPIDGARYNAAVGTSGAAAQISALAFLLYDKKARATGNRLASSLQAVKLRIVSSEQGILNDPNDPSRVLAGVADFSEALTGW
jgi:hypothetical protein